MKPHAVFALAAFLETRRLQRSLRTPEDVARHRERRLRAFFRHVPRAPFYAGMKPRRLEDLPIVDKAQVNARFEAFNIAGVTADEAWAAIAEGRRVRGLIAGCSTGTSGNRGLFLASERERFVWLGVMLAKALPDVLSRRHRVALVLPAASELYEAAPDSGRLALRFFDLRAGLAAWRDQLDAYRPDVIVAPPKILRALAESPGALAPAQVFSGAEVLDPLDRAVIETTFGVTVREIYQATEGLFGVACERGVLHLCEDTVAFEWEPVAGSRLVQPLVTDFTRRTQVMARYRMNDLLDFAEEPCACGSPLRAVRAIHGRQDDIFDLGALVTPDILRNAVVDADRR
ncbi:hypothetical protein, partial [Brevundimonas sp.]|uniref:hypothetical protein n=1 Tax=Brevundimonas sp. TaxID=1871086 RepID=UPI0025F74FD4